MAITICAVSGNVKNLLGNNVQDVIVTAHVATPFVHTGGPTIIAGIIASTTTSSAGNFTLSLVETTTVSQRIVVVLDYFDGSTRRKKSYPIVVPNAATATFTDLVTADSALASVSTLPASLVTVVPAGNLAATNAQSALEELQTDVDTRATSAALTTHTAASSGVHGVVGSVVGTTDAQTLTNKTLTTPIIAAISNIGTLTLPTSTDTLVGRATTDTLTNKTLTSPTINTPTLVGSGGTLTLPAGPDTLVGRATTDTLTNKTLTSPTINTPTIAGSGGTLTLPAGPDTLVGRATTDTLTNKTLTLPVIASISNGGTVTIPSGADTLVARTSTDTLTNKTLTTPAISSISNGGTVTIPSGTDTLVARTSTDTLTNKTLTLPVIASISNGGTVTIPSGADTLVARTSTDTLTNKTLTLPVIASISNGGTVTIPSGADTLVARTSTDTLTNKSISGSTNTITNVSLTAGVTGTLPAANGGTAQSTYATGDLIYASASNTLAKKAIGSTGQVLTVAAGIPSWATPAAYTSPLGHEVTVDSGNGHGAVANKVRRFSNARKNVGTAITYADDANAGGTFTINTTGLYSISYCDRRTAGVGSIGIMVNSTATTTAQNLTYAQGSRMTAQTIATLTSAISWTGNLASGDVVRAQTDGNSDATDSNCMFTITAIALS